MPAASATPYGHIAIVETARVYEILFADFQIRPTAHAIIRKNYRLFSNSLISSVYSQLSPSYPYVLARECLGHSPKENYWCLPISLTGWWRRRATASHCLRQPDAEHGGSNRRQCHSPPNGSNGPVTLAHNTLDNHTSAVVPSTIRQFCPSIAASTVCRPTPRCRRPESRGRRCLVGFGRRRRG